MMTSRPKENSPIRDVPGALQWLAKKYSGILLPPYVFRNDMIPR
jgi:hypothetical protein